MTDSAEAPSARLAKTKSFSFKGAGKLVQAGVKIETTYKAGSLAARIAAIKAGLKPAADTVVKSGGESGEDAVPVAPAQTETTLREELSVLSGRLVQLLADNGALEKRLADAVRATASVEQRRQIAESVSKARVAQLEERLSQYEQREQRGVARVQALEDELAAVRLQQQSVSMPNTVTAASTLSSPSASPGPFHAADCLESPGSSGCTAASPYRAVAPSAPAFAVLDDEQQQQEKEKVKHEKLPKVKEEQQSECQGECEQHAQGADMGTARQQKINRASKCNSSLLLFLTDSPQKPALRGAYEQAP
jgi:hypothetical protein